MAMQTVFYPEGDTYNDTPISAKGRSGFIKCAGIGLSWWGGHRIHMHPINSRKVASDACRIDIPADSTVITSLIDALIELREKLERAGE